MQEIRCVFLLETFFLPYSQAPCRLKKGKRRNVLQESAKCDNDTTVLGPKKGVLLFFLPVLPVNLLLSMSSLACEVFFSCVQFLRS